MKTLAYAIGTIMDKSNYNIFYGKTENVKNAIKKENRKYWSIYYYKTQLELEDYIKTDRAFFKLDMEGVNFIKV